MDYEQQIDLWIDASFRERVLRAREQPPAEKLMAGPELFDMVCRFMAAGIRNEEPHADEARVREVLLQRLALARRLEAAV